MSHAFLNSAFTTPQAAWVAHCAVPAVVAGYPLLESVRTCHVQTTPGTAAYGRAPFNHFGHSAERWTDRDRDIVTPANDLLYSNAWIDLRRGPVVITVPPQTGRYFVLELLDTYTNNFHNIGTRNVPAQGGRFALLGPDGTHAAPQGTTPIQCPTALVWVLVDGDADVVAARGVQAGFAIDAPAAADAPASVAQWQTSGDDPALAFFANLARALRDFPPPASQQGAFDLLRGAHVKLDADGGLGDLRPATLEGLRTAYASAMKIIDGASRPASKAPWRYSTRLGRYGDDLLLRAATAWKGLGALAGDEAIYATTDYDDHGEELDGDRLYRLHFEDGGRIPAGAFWSISLYGADRYFAANAIGRHALGNRSPLERHPDGSLTLYVSRRRPPGPEENWLPAPSGAFYLILRVYHPQPAFLSGAYRMPKLERVA
jgi:hypothetical protein